jgi:TolA-binding protein
MGRLCELSLDCLDVLSDEPELTGEKYREILQQHVALLKNLNQREKVVACYTRYISRFVDSAQAAPVMLELADYYRDGWKTPAQAKDAYVKLCETYPGSAEAPVARMKEALCLYELGSFEDAYARIQEMVAAGVAPDPATAEFLLALTEAAMNMEEDAEARLIRLVNAFPAHETAPKSVFWIANSRFARQDYKGAKEMFAELVQRYPKSSYTKKAGDYVKRLDLLDAAK